MAKLIIDEIKFEGIDSWNRPIFKSTKFNNRYGSVDILFNYEDTEDTVLTKITEKDLVFFGSSFDCEPMGDPVIGTLLILDKNQ